MDAVADLADRFSFGELRVTHEQNVVLADVRQRDLIDLWKIARAHGLVDPAFTGVAGIVRRGGMHHDQRRIALEYNLFGRGQARFGAGRPGRGRTEEQGGGTGQRTQGSERKANGVCGHDATPESEEIERHLSDPSRAATGP